MENEKKEEIKIDISNISNLNAMRDENPSISDFADKGSKPKISKEDSVKKAMNEGYKVESFPKYPRKFEFVQAERVELPSHGLPYKSCEDPDVRDGFVMIYPLTMKEEEILSTQKYINEGTATIMALNNCLKSNIDAMDLVVQDFYYLLMYLRKISISDEFRFKITCPHCNHEFERKILISEQNFDELDKDTFKEPIRVDLESTNYTVLLGLPRIRSIRELSWMMNNDNGKDFGVANFIYTRTIAIIDPSGEEVPKDQWIYFFNNLPHKDSTKLIEAIEVDNGVSHIVGGTTCPSCGEKIEGSSIDLNTDELFRFE